MANETAGASGEPAPSKPSGSGLWDKLPAIMATINPVLLLVIGYFLNAGIERTKIEIAQTRVQIEENSAKLQDLKTSAETDTILIHARVDKVQVIRDFINDLSGPDERRRSLAIQAIFIALPEDAPRLVNAVKEFADKGGVTAVSNKDVAAAKDALATARNSLVNDMFSVARPTRQNALITLERGWTTDLPIVDLLITRAMSDVKAREAKKWATSNNDESQQMKASIYNTVKFLSYFNPEVLEQSQKSTVAGFLAAAVPNSDDTREVVAAIQPRFQ